MFLWAAGILISNHESGISHGKPELSLFWCKHENAVGILFVQHFGWEQWLLYFMTQWNLSSCQEQGGITIAYKCSSHVWPQIVITGEKWTSNDKQSHILYVYLNLFMFSLTVMMMIMIMIIRITGLLDYWLTGLLDYYMFSIPVPSFDRASTILFPMYIYSYINIYFTVRYWYWRHTFVDSTPKTCVAHPG